MIDSGLLVYGGALNQYSIEFKEGAYDACKVGVRIFTKSAALHFATSGYHIRVNSIHPGIIETPMTTSAA